MQRRVIGCLHRLSSGSGTGLEAAVEKYFSRREKSEDRVASSHLSESARLEQSGRRDVPVVNHRFNQHVTVLGFQQGQSSKHCLATQSLAPKARAYLQTNGELRRLSLVDLDQANGGLVGVAKVDGKYLGDPCATVALLNELRRSAGRHLRDKLIQSGLTYIGEELVRDIGVPSPQQDPVCPLLICYQGTYLQESSPLSPFTFDIASARSTSQAPVCARSNKEACDGRGQPASNWYVSAGNSSET